MAAATRLRGALLASALAAAAQPAREGAAPPAGFGADAPRVAVCLAGEARSLVAPAVRANLRGALLEPLGAGADVFAFLGAGKLPRARVEAAARELSPVVLCVEDARPARPALGPPCAPPGAARAAPPPADSDARGCVTSGFAMYERLHRCFGAVQAHERAVGVLYTHVLRARPDLALERALPPLPPMRRGAARLGRRAAPAGWANGSRVLWDHAPRPRASRAPVPLRAVSFLADWLALVPRPLCASYFSAPALSYARCVPARPPPGAAAGPSGCAGASRWRWNECRLLTALWRAAPPGTLVAELPIGRAHVHLVRCVPARGARAADGGAAEAEAPRARARRRLLQPAANASGGGWDACARIVLRAKTRRRGRGADGAPEPPPPLGARVDDGDDGGGRLAGASSAAAAGRRPWVELDARALLSAHPTPARWPD